MSLSPDFYVHGSARPALRPQAPLYATPMAYLKKRIGGVFAWMTPAFVLLVLIQGLVGANLIQSNSVAHALQGELGVPSLPVAFCVSALVGLVIVGGLRRIVDFSAAITPWMVMIYVVVAAAVILSNPASAVEFCNPSCTTRSPLTPSRVALPAIRFSKRCNTACPAAYFPTARVWA